MLLPLGVLAQSNRINWSKSNTWVDSVYNILTEDERIGQLFMIDVWSMRDSAHFKNVESLIKDYKVGGLIFLRAIHTGKQHLPICTKD